MRSTVFLIIFIFLFTGTGCVSGLIYTDTIFPLTNDVHRTPVGRKICAVNSKQLQEPITGINIALEWDSRAIGDAARQAGIETVYFADMRTRSVLGGLWEQQIICICGE